MKISKKQLMQIIKEEKERLMLEMNPDGTVSEDEEEAEEELMISAEMRINELIDMIQAEAYRIGGTFRSPGIRKRVYQMVSDKLRGAR